MLKNSHICSPQSAQLPSAGPRLRRPFVLVGHLRHLSLFSSAAVPASFPSWRTTDMGAQMWTVSKEKLLCPAEKPGVGISSTTPFQGDGKNVGGLWKPHSWPMSPAGLVANEAAIGPLNVEAASPPKCLLHSPQLGCHLDYLSIPPVPSGCEMSSLHPHSSTATSCPLCPVPPSSAWFLRPCCDGSSKDTFLKSPLPLTACLRLWEGLRRAGGKSQSHAHCPAWHV